MNKLLSAFFAVFLFSACTSDETTTPSATSQSPSSGQSATQTAAVGGTPFTVELTPTIATRKSTLNLTATGQDLSAAKIEWLVNGNPFTPPVSTQFYGADVAKGASVQARVTIENREVLSNIVTILNTPPEVGKVRLLPEVFKPGDTFFVEAEGADLDGDSVTLLYEWTKNGAPAGKESKLETPVKRGDKISIKITPYDGEDYGKAVFLEQEIQNLPPVIVDHKDFTFDGTTCTYQTQASDPDGDALVYSVESSQPGMTIDPGTGLLKWVVPAEFKGKQEVFINANDGHGGTARYCLRIAIE